MAPAPRPPTGARPRSTWSLRTARCSRMRSFTSSQSVVVLVEDPGRLVEVDPVLGLDAPGQLEHGVEPGPDPPVLGALLAQCARACRSRARPPCAPRSGRSAARPPGAVVVGLVLVVGAQLPQLLADGLELAAQQELALGLLHALLDVGLDPLAQREVGEHLAGPGEHQAQAVDDVDRLEDLHLLGERQVGRVAGHVGHPARLGDARPAARPGGRPRGSPGCSPPRPGTRGPAPAVSSVGARPRRPARPRPTGPGRCRARRCRGGPARRPARPPRPCRRAARPDSMTSATTPTDA